MINKLEIGEILRIKGRDYILSETSIGGTDKKKPHLILLDNTIKGMNRKPYFKDNCPKKSFHLRQKDINKFNLRRLSFKGCVVTGEENEKFIKEDYLK